MDSEEKLLSGISEIINRANTQKDVNFSEVEKLMLGSDISRTRDPTETFKNELASLAKQLGLDSGTPTPIPGISGSSQRGQTPLAGSARLSAVPSQTPRQQTPRQQTPRQQTPRQQTPPPSPQPSVFEFVGPEDEEQKPSHDFSDLGLGSDADFALGEREEAIIEDNYHNDFTSPEIKRRTDEERRHDQVRDFMSSLPEDDSKFVSLEDTKREDEKLIMLEEIDSLMTSLAEEDSRALATIPKVTQNDDYALVENVLRRLRLKNDRTRYTSFADEFLLWGSQCLEEVFNGKRTWFGKQPDLTGWSKEVQVKVRRMRHDTSTIVSEVMHDYNIGPMMRIALELVPNMFMYARRRKQNHGKSGLYADTDISKYMNNIRDIEDA